MVILADLERYFGSMTKCIDDGGLSKLEDDKLVHTLHMPTELGAMWH